jgi:hypothetical protein
METAKRPNTESRLEVLLSLTIPYSVMAFNQEASMCSLIRATFLIASVLTVLGCASRSVLSDPDEVKVSREEPKDCQEIGKITGNSQSTKGTQEQALEDLKREAANKGANYVVVKQYSDYGTAVTGIAYNCH